MHAHQTNGTKNGCCPTTPPQPEPRSGENFWALEDNLPGSSSQEVNTTRPQWLLTSCPHILCDEGAEETGLGPSEAAVRVLLDHLQFAYQPHLGVDDAFISLLQWALDGGGSTVRIIFFVDTSTVSWACLFVVCSTVILPRHQCKRSPRQKGWIEYYFSEQQRSPQRWDELIQRSI